MSRSRTMAARPGSKTSASTVPAGRKVAIVGPSGSGKSTLLKLLFRFYDVNGGRVRVDGQDVRDLTQTSLREAIGLVPQDVVLFNSTLRENLIYGKPEASDEEVREAARKAQLSDFIDSLPQGWETRVGERGVKLSGGERQRVGIARTILKNPAILVLDEATSALDSATEADVQGALGEASSGRTTLMVAHRLSTIAGADEIIVLDQGRIAERGTHAQLLAKGGLYADLWAGSRGRTKGRRGSWKSPRLPWRRQASAASRPAGDKCAMISEAIVAADACVPRSHSSWVNPMPNCRSTIDPWLIDGVSRMRSGEIVPYCSTADRQSSRSRQRSVAETTTACHQGLDSLATMRATDCRPSRRSRSPSDERPALER